MVLSDFRLVCKYHPSVAVLAHLIIISRGDARELPSTRTAWVPWGSSYGTSPELSAWSRRSTLVETKLTANAVEGHCLGLLLHQEPILDQVTAWSSSSYPNYFRNWCCLEASWSSLMKFFSTVWRSPSASHLLRVCWIIQSTDKDPVPPASCS